MARNITVEVSAKAPWVDEPGSPEAVEKGCTCSQAQNKFGKGVRRPEGQRWYPDPLCPVHGVWVAKTAGEVKMRAAVEATRKRKARTR